MKKVLLLQNIHTDGRAIFAARADVVVDLLDGIHHHDQDVLAHIGDAHAVTIRKAHISREIISRAPCLMVISKHGVGTDNIDLMAATEHGIVVINEFSVLTRTVAEHALTMLFCLARQVRLYDEATRRGDLAVRDSLAASDLFGKLVLVIGFGRVGRELARLCRVLDLEVAAYDPYAPAAAFDALGVNRITDLRAAWPCVDAVAVTCPLTDETRGLIGRAELALMKPTATLVNVARGGIVDETALHEALAAGRLKGAGLDVFVGDFPGPDNPLVNNPRVILSPHSAALTADCARALGIAVARNALAVMDGTFTADAVVNREVLGRSNLRAPLPR